MKSAYDIVKAPILTEKSYDYIAHRVYTFEVAKTANKIEIAKAVEEIFGVKVQSGRAGMKAVVLPPRRPM